MLSITYGWHLLCPIRSHLAFEARRDYGRRMTFRIQTWADRNVVIFRLSGQFDDEAVRELERLFEAYGNDLQFVLDLKDAGLVGRDALKFLTGCRTEGVELKNCPAYVREWILRDEHDGR